MFNNDNGAARYSKCPNAGRLFFVLLSAYLLTPNAISQETDEAGAIEEVTVTGSYIRSTATDNASPVEIISSDYIANSGAIDVGELTAKWSFRIWIRKQPRRLYRRRDPRN
jgi:hypothetical protein